MIKCIILMKMEVVFNGCSDDEEAVFHLDCSIEESERNDEKIKKRKGSRQNIRRL